MLLEPTITKQLFTICNTYYIGWSLAILGPNQMLRNYQDPVYTFYSQFSKTITKVVS